MSNVQLSPRITRLLNSLIALLALVLFPKAAYAQGFDADQCRIHLQSEASLSSELKVIFADYSDYPAVAVCTSGIENSKKRYALLSAVEHSASGICRFSRVDLFGYGTTRSVRESRLQYLYMLRSESECPSWQDSHYVATKGVSDDVFKKAMRLWADVEAPGGIQRTLAPHPYQPDPYIQEVLQKAAEGGTILQEIESWGSGNIDGISGPSLEHYAMYLCVKAQLFTYIIVVFYVSSSGAHVLTVMSTAD